MSVLLQTRQLSLHAAGRELIRGLDLAVQPGERWVVIGRNAAGKSTLLRALAGLAVPQFDGEIQRPARLAWLPQQAQDRFDLRVLEYLLLQRDDGEPFAPALALHEALDMAHLTQRPITQLSGGERQRVGLAAVAWRDAPLWLLDEPVSFQDPAHQQMLANWLCSQPCQSVVMTAHDMNWVSQVATHVMALTPDGVVCGPRDEVLQAPVLERTFGCAWQQVQGRWFAA